jgi:hypothetical protein
MRSPRLAPAVTSLLLAALFTGCASWFRSSSGPRDLQRALTFHASFDGGTDAEVAQADPWLYHAPAMDQWSEARPGLPADGEIQWTPTEGKFGGALHFAQRADPVVFYRAAQNVPWSARDWGGTVSFWLRTDLASLAEGFCDPVQLTPRKWNDAAFFVEFEKREDSVPFRLGAYADFAVWNPDRREWGDIPASEKPLVTVSGPPFAGDRWTHVVFTWDQFNTGEKNGRAVLYLNGAQVGALLDRKQTFTWDPAEARLLLGVGYVGWIDDIAVFNRPLTVEEVQVLRALPNGIHSLR